MWDGAEAEAVWNGSNSGWAHGGSFRFRALDVSLGGEMKFWEKLSAPFEKPCAWFVITREACAGYKVELYTTRGIYEVRVVTNAQLTQSREEAQLVLFEVYNEMISRLTDREQIDAGASWNLLVFPILGNLVPGTDEVGLKTDAGARAPLAEASERLPVWGGTS